MKQQTLNNLAVACLFLGVAASALPASAQSRLRGLERVSAKASQRSSAAAHHFANGPTPALLPTPGSPSYIFSFIDFPQSPDTATFGINPSATSSKMGIVGTYGTEVDFAQYGVGFLLEVTQEKANFIEKFITQNVPGATNELPGGINDSGHIVGSYYVSPNTYPGYELFGGKFSKIQVPFTGAILTAPTGINNSGEIVGTWADSSLVDHGFLLNAGTYTSFDYPGAAATDGIRINATGEIAGFFYDTAGLFHGFVLSGGTYTQIDYPGATGTIVYGSDDAGDLVGFYCSTTECLTDYSGSQGFVLSGGVYTTINVPAASETVALDISNNGVIVGWYLDSDGNTHAFSANP